MRYNKSEIFKTAWRNVKAAGISFAEALRNAWAMAKAGHKVVKVADWFLNKLNDEVSKYNWTLVSRNELYINRTIAETEKAIKVEVECETMQNGNCRYFTAWMPKSVVLA